MESFTGYERPDGAVGIRNYVAILPSVSCANGVVSAIAREVPEAVPLYHQHGCGRGGTDMGLHNRTLQNLCKNPNIAAVLVIGLGCEVVKSDGLALVVGLSKKPVEHLVIQKEGGSQKTARKGIELARSLLEKVSTLEKTEFPLEKLTLGLECGGSDAFSGITANPGVGIASDWLVEQGGTVILTETTEMIGTSHILERRAANSESAKQIAEIISSTEQKTREVLGDMAKVAISPGNMDGGMSSIREKSLGCIVKAGTSNINQVMDYAEIPREKGLVVMHGPGYDTESMTGLAAGGAQVIIFTTGMGNPIGFPTVPVIKVASTSQMYTAMEDDMDVNAGVILEGKELADVGSDIIGLIRRVLNGEKTKAEINQQNGILCMYSQKTSF